MKKFIIFAIIIILIFMLSIFIGTKLKLPKVDEIIQEEESIGSTEQEERREEKQEEKRETEINEIEPAVSEEEPNKEHYVLREVEKQIKVYSIDDNEKEELYMNTNIATEYLPETDKASLEQGIHVYSKGELNEILQDFE